MRTDTHSFAGYDVIENNEGKLSIMVPHRNKEGVRFYRPEGSFATRGELAAYCHGRLIGWGKM
jgi:hypothetical protein